MTIIVKTFSFNIFLGSLHGYLSYFRVDSSNDGETTYAVKCMNTQRQRLNFSEKIHTQHPFRLDFVEGERREGEDLQQCTLKYENFFCEEFTRNCFQANGHEIQHKISPFGRVLATKPNPPSIHKCEHSDFIHNA